MKSNKASIKPKDKTSIKPKDKTSIKPKGKTSIKPKGKTSIKPKGKTTIKPETKVKAVNKRESRSNTNKRGFSDINPISDDFCDFEELNDLGLNEMSQAIPEDGINNLDYIIPNSLDNLEPNIVQDAMSQAINLDSNSEPLTHEKLKSWQRFTKSVRKFEMILIFMCIELKIFQTLKMKQGEFFEEYFNYPSYKISKIYKRVKTLLFLYCGFESISEIKDRNDLNKIGDENDHVIDLYSSIKSKNGDQHLLAVFNKCKQLITEEPTITKITGQLVEKVSEILIQQSSLQLAISNGATGDYNKFELAELDNKPEDKTLNKNKIIVSNLKRNCVEIQRIMKASEDNSSIFSEVEVLIKNLNQELLKLNLDS